MKYALQVNNKDLDNLNPLFKPDIEFDFIKDLPKNIYKLCLDKKFPLDIIFYKELDKDEGIMITTRYERYNDINLNDIIRAYLNKQDEYDSNK